MKARLAGAATAVAALFLGAAVCFAVLVYLEPEHPTATGMVVPIPVIVVALGLPILLFGAALGVAVTPERVVRAGLRRPFAIAFALATLAVVCALPSPAACLSWPVALVLAGVSTWLFVYTVRAARRALTGDTRVSSGRHERTQAERR